MLEIELYSKGWCPYCWSAKALLKSKGLDYTEINLTFDTRRTQEMIERSKRRTVPQVFIGGRSIGGYDDLADLNASGALDRMLATAAATQTSEDA